MFTTFDFLALGTIIICMVLSASRGLINELFDFGGWIVSLLLARMLAASVANAVFPAMQPRSMAVVCSFVLVFILTRLAQHFLRFVLNSAITKTQFTTSVNRTVGAILGVLKGVLFVSIAVFACSFSNLPKQDDWQDAATSAFFESIVKTSVPYLPEVFADQIYFPPRGTSVNEAPSPRRHSKPQVERLTP